MLLRVSRTIFLLIFFVIFFGVGQVKAVVPAVNITVNLPSRTIELFSGDRLVKEYPIAIGKLATPTPLGSFAVDCKEINPVWYPPDRQGIAVPSGPDNPLGYRWIGFWNTYGIHGTNAPWSIRLAVSNGCIRMYEEDVEELFDMVNVGTPVKVTYDRVNVRKDAKGQILLSVYPDIYGSGTITIADIKSRLNAYRLNALVSNDLLKKLLDEPGDRRVVIASQFGITVNGVLLGESGLTVGDVQYVPILPVAQAFKQKIAWDEKTKSVLYGKTIVPGIDSNGVVYVARANAGMLFQVEQNWKAGENLLAFGAVAAFLNEKPVYLEVNKLQGMPAVSARSLADALGRQINWDESTQSLTMDDKGKSIKVPVSMIGATPYVKITDINQYFDVYVYWNDEGKTLELTT
ncbi:L,D-transpeptidase family protein [Sporomusa aerivorans]|uniref:L,D-transpeptidase family protein n=1 Tax=Sporomusa aerivorans TaxID=204936 RepID=UPI00352ADCF4